MKPAGRDLAISGGATKQWAGVPSHSQAHYGGVVARAIKPKVLYHTQCQATCPFQALRCRATTEVSLLSHS